ncbi:MAG TPA: glucokinase [Polyangiales bacterium]|nr:glucokinase [Polyangiales bacterium]
MRILAGDIGGTKTDLALYDGTTIVARKRYPSRDYPSLTAVALEFLGTITIDAAAFAVAGPVRDGRCKATNLPWEMDEVTLKGALRAPVTLLNDLAAVIFGIPELDPQADLVVLHEGEREAQGPIAVVAAGTGLGEAIGVPTARGLRVLPSEGGHTDLAPRNEVEIALLRFMYTRHPARVSSERVLSGPGLIAIYDFVVAQGLATPKPETRAEMSTTDPAAVIGRLGSSGEDPACERALSLFVSLYGSEAGNLALKVLPTGGLYIGGGIAPKILERLRRGDFLQALQTKGRMSDVLQTIPVSVVTSKDVAVIGAHAAAKIAFAAT